MRDSILPEFDPKEIAWLAGLLEGEGSFGFWRRRLVIHLRMTDRDVVDRAAALLGWNQTYPWQPKGPNRKLAYMVSCYGDLAREWMVLILPFMGKRRTAKIKEVMTAWDEHGAERQRLRYRGRPAECHPNRRHKGHGLCSFCYRRANYLPNDPRRRLQVDPLQRDWIFLRGIEGQPKYDLEAWLSQISPREGQQHLGKSGRG